MNTLFDILPHADGTKFIRDCWGEVPQFKHIEILHLKHSISQNGADVSIVAVLTTYESDDINECKPSKIVMQFCDVSHFEFIDAFGDHPAHGIKLDPIFTSQPPAGVFTIDTRDGFYVACRLIRVISCVYDPCQNLRDETKTS